MGRARPVALRQRVADFVDDGNSHRAAARHFRVSSRFVNDLIKAKKATGNLDPRRQGNPGRGKLSDVKSWVRERLEEKNDLTLDALVDALDDTHGIKVDRSAVCRLLHRPGL